MNIDENDFIPYEGIQMTKEESIDASRDFFKFMNKRRSIRDFSDEDVAEEIIENIIKTASSAPSGAHKQPWHFCVIRSKELKTKIRELAEQEEKINYESRMSDRWKEDLAHLGTNEIKEFLSTVPWIIVVMRKSFTINKNGEKENNYYVNESVGIACGFLIAAIHHAGLATLTHTPSPMGFLSKVLNRPEEEKPYLLLPIGYPRKDCKVPNLKRKIVEEIANYYR